MSKILKNFNRDKVCNKTDNLLNLVKNTMTISKIMLKEKTKWIKFNKWGKNLQRMPLMMAITKTIMVTKLHDGNSKYI